MDRFCAGHSPDLYERDLPAVMRPTQPTICPMRVHGCRLAVVALAVLLPKSLFPQGVLTWLRQHVARGRDVSDTANLNH